MIFVRTLGIAIPSVGLTGGIVLKDDGNVCIV